MVKSELRTAFCETKIGLSIRQQVFTKKQQEKVASRKSHLADLLKEKFAELSFENADVKAEIRNFVVSIKDIV